MSSPLDSIEIRIHGAGWPFIIAGIVLTVILGWIWPPLGWLMAVVTCWVAYFFRDPDRVTPARPGLVISPADGRVQMITMAAPPQELGMGEAPRTRISVFLNIFDVHVNRAPVGGRVTRLAHHPGKFLNAAQDKASEDNERQSLGIETSSGDVFGCVQIAGLIARRIVCAVHEGDVEKEGFARFADVIADAPDDLKVLFRMCESEAMQRKSPSW